MTKKEIIWREILHQTIEKKNIEFTQKGLAEKFSVSLSTVFNALRVPRQAGAVSVSGRGFRVQDVEKFLYLWATQRNLEKEVLYATHSGESLRATEGSLPPQAIFACYSAYRMKYQDAPADYDKTYFYIPSSEIANIKQMFPPRPGYTNLIALRSDPHLSGFGSVTPDVQTFVDLWSLKDWYAHEFVKALKEKML